MIDSFLQQGWPLYFADFFPDTYLNDYYEFMPKENVRAATIKAESSVKNFQPIYYYRKTVFISLTSYTLRSYCRSPAKIHHPAACCRLSLSPQSAPVWASLPEIS